MNKQYQLTIYPRPYDVEIWAENEKQAESIFLQGYGDNEQFDIYKVEVRLECSNCEQLFSEDQLSIDKNGDLLCKKCQDKKMIYIVEYDTGNLITSSYFIGKYSLDHQDLKNQAYLHLADINDVDLSEAKKLFKIVEVYPVSERTIKKVSESEEK